jgi:hypothetical protein
MDFHALMRFALCRYDGFALSQTLFSSLSLTRFPVQKCTRGDKFAAADAFETPLLKFAHCIWRRDCDLIEFPSQENALVSDFVCK